MDILDKTSYETREVVKNMKNLIIRMEKIENQMKFIDMEYRDLVDENNELMEAINREFSKQDVKRIIEAMDRIQKEKEEKELEKEGITMLDFDKLLSVLAENKKESNITAKKTAFG